MIIFQYGDTVMSLSDLGVWVGSVATAGGFFYTWYWNRKIEMARIEPIVQLLHIEFQSDPQFRGRHFLYVDVRNLGPGPALSLKVRLDPTRSGGTTLEMGMELLPQWSPGAPLAESSTQRLQTQLTSLGDIPKAGIVHVSFRTVAGKRRRFTKTFDKSTNGPYVLAP